LEILLPYLPIDLNDKLALFSDHWSPKIIAQMNDYHIKLVKVQGDFVWHSHPETDEVFLVLKGELRIDFRDGHVTVRAGELYVVPRGLEHKPYAEGECQLMLIEPAGTINTGDAGGELTAEHLDWI
jgi:mannose-6-phosphate isomerase-like protein (cupin superfamily)